MRKLLALVALTTLATAAMAHPKVAMIVEGRGTVVFELRPDESPKLVAHFLSLVDKKFYDRILFHRKVDGFVAQTGDPASRSWTPAKARSKPGQMGGTEGLGEGGSGNPVQYEVNNLIHDKYTIGMALESPFSDTGDSQFFINLADNHRLNGMYCVFGIVVEGKDVVDKIMRGDRIRSIRRVTGS